MTSLNEAERLFQVIQEALGESAPAQQIAVFLAVARAHARNEDLEVLDVGARCNMSSASTSRNLAALGDWHWRQKPGRGLLKLSPMLADRRRKTVKLTPKGEKLAKRIEAV